MKGLKLFYFTVGGILILTSAIAFVYFLLFGYKATGYQLLAATVLGGVGSIFMTIGHDMERSR